MKMRGPDEMNPHRSLTGLVTALIEKTASHTRS